MEINLGLPVAIGMIILGVAFFAHIIEQFKEAAAAERRRKEQYREWGMSTDEQ